MHKERAQNLKQSILEMTKKPENANIEGVELRTF